METGTLTKAESGEVLLTQVTWCQSFLCKLRGLMFRSNLAQGEGLLMVEPGENRTGTAIHMLFMNFPIATIWLDREFCVVDKVLAEPWRLVYTPAQPAMYTLETNPALLELVDLGDCLEFTAGPQA